MPLIGRATTRFGSGQVTTALAFGTYLVIIGPGLAGNLAELVVALMLWGLATGGLDVAMNSQAVQVETSYRRPIMSSFHAYWSIGTVLGTVLGGIGAGLGCPWPGQQAGLGCCWRSYPMVVRQFIGDHPAQEYQAGKRVFEFRLVLLGVAGVCALLAEGSAADWSPVYLRDDLQVSPGQAGIAFAAFTVMMTVGRLTGDRLVLALGRSRSLSLLAGVGALGMSASLLSNTLIGSSIGFACLGLGLSVMVPVIFSTAADGPGAAGPSWRWCPASATWASCSGRPALGPLAHATSVHAALWVLPTFAALAGLLGVTAVRMTARLSRPESHSAA